MSKAVTGEFLTCRRLALKSLTFAYDMMNRLIDSPISTPCSRWEKYRHSRTSWGINVLGSFLIEIEATDGTVGLATGFGGKTSTRLLPLQKQMQHPGGEKKKKKKK